MKWPNITFLYPDLFLDFCKFITIRLPGENTTNVEWRRYFLLLWHSFRRDRIRDKTWLQNSFSGVFNQWGPWMEFIGLIPSESISECACIHLWGKGPKFSSHSQRALYLKKAVTFIQLIVTKCSFKKFSYAFYV